VPWLAWINPASPGGSGESPGASGDDRRSSSQQQQQGQEEPTNTAAARDRNGFAAAAEVSTDEWHQAKPIANRLLKALWPDTGLGSLRVERQRWLAKLGVLALRRGNGFMDPLFSAIKRTPPKKPEGFVGKILNDQLRGLGTSLDRELGTITVPDRFLPAHNQTKESVTNGNQNL
jgi:hypothetical protein